MPAHAEFVWFDGSVVPWDQARVHVSTATVLRGANIFEGIRGYWNAEERELYLFRNDVHLARLWESAKIMRMTVPWSAEELTSAEIAILRANRFEENVWFRLTLYVGEGEEHTWPPEQVWVGGFIVARPAPHSAGVRDGVDSCTSTWVRISDTSVPPRVKTGANYHNSRLASMEARLNGYSGPPVLLNERGKVAESTGACLCMVRRGTLVTPPVTSNILESVTRATLLELARADLGMPVEEREVDRTELYVAEEAFFCGTGWEIMPVNSLDHYPVGKGRPGEVTRRLQELYFSVAAGRVPRYRHWLTPVYRVARAAV